MSHLHFLNGLDGTSGHIEYPVVNEFIIKLASRCNIRCTYCYWFEDPLVLQSPKIISDKHIDLFLEKLRQHLLEYQLNKISIAFHGGEPTLYPLEKFNRLCESLIAIQAETGCELKLSMQTNALLLDKAWLASIKQFKVLLGVSLDGSQLVHDQYRIDHKGRGTFERTINQIRRIKRHGIPVYLLSVASPEVSPVEQIDLFVNKLQVYNFDVLIPHLHYGHKELSIADYYCRLFDEYLDKYLDLGVNIRLLDGMMCQLVGGKSSIQGYGFISTVTLLTDGHLEATDDLRMIENLPISKIHIETHQLQQVTEDPLWQAVYSNSINLVQKCQDCEFKKICGSGPLVTRWSDANGFANPSVFCKDFETIINHIKQRLMPYFELRFNSTTATQSFASLK
ncbi:radical SAM protein [Aliikangiella marina]|uniref:Radical SAM protein n=1 Tax=Aliikangiella marina TaxID=1712262 RepID=A0A545TJ66_9GAMM|nr:radical SAM protein [Aliikangiella marina]TQV77284.1 radical SAM protein [Aliikangiella marina]